MSTDIIDDGDEWRVPLKDAPDRMHMARVRIIQSGLAAEILAIPDDVTPLARKRRITKARYHADRWIDWMCTKHIRGLSHTVAVTNEGERTSWWQAASDAWETVKRAIEAGDTLTQFLLNGGELDEITA